MQPQYHLKETNSMKKIAIIGASGLGKEIWSIIHAINNVAPTWEIVGFYDDIFTEKFHVYQNTFCLGKVDTLLTTTEPIDIVFAISDRKIVNKIVQKFHKNANLSFPNIIHPNNIINPIFSFGIGNVIAIETNISCDVAIGNFNFLNGGIGIGHDVTLGNFNSIMPRVQIAGNVDIGNFNTLGMGAAVLQGKSIGNNNEILSFTFLTKSIKDNRKYFGIPGKRIDV